MPSIDRVEARALTIPTDAPESDGTLAWNSTTMVLVRVAAGDRSGLGWTYGPAACVNVVHDLLRAELLGGEPMDIPRLWQRLVDHVRNVGRSGVCGYAISAVDVALWDLKARLLGIPLWQLLGRVSDRVKIYGSGGFTCYDDERLTRQLRGWVDEGIGRVKMKVGGPWVGGPDHDVERVRLAREAIGPSAELFIDANGAYGAKEAIRLLRTVDDCHVTWLEEPVSSEDLIGLRQVRDAVSADVAAGEYGGDLAYFRRMCAAEAVDCLQIDATRCGGYTGWMRAAATAAAHGLDVSAHCAPQLHAPIAVATPRVRHLEWFHDHARIESRLFSGALVPSDGALTLAGDAPGHGLELDEAAAGELTEPP